MKKKQNVDLIEFLAQLDFNLIEFNHKQSFSQNKDINLKTTKKSYFTLNYVSIVKSIKQVARMFQFFKSKKKIFNPDIFSDNVSSLKLFSTFLKNTNSLFSTPNSKKNLKNSLNFSLFLNKNIS